MNIDIMTLFPESVNAMMHVSILGRAIERGHIQIRSHQIYTVKGEKEYLIPAVKGAFIHSVDLDANRMEVHVWEGLATDEH